MKTFLKTTLAMLVALIIFSIISTAVSLGVLASMLSASDAPTVLKENSVFELNLNGMLVERVDNGNLNAMLMKNLNKKTNEISLSDIRASLKKAAEEDNIKALYLNCNTLSGVYASVQELRSLVLKFKEESGKPVYAYADNYMQGAYWIASVADSVFLNPQGVVALTGVAMPTPFFKEALDKLGVEMQIFKVGTFKSAVEPYILNEMSDANRLQMTRMTEGLWNIVSSDIASARNISVQSVDDYVNNGGYFQASETVLNNKLVDALKYRSEVEDFLEEKFGDDVDMVSLTAMTKVPSKDKFSLNKVAVLYAMGGIDTQQDQGMQSEKIVEELNKLADDDNIKAVVLRVNSPGGSAFGSDQMWFAAKQLKAKKPLIVSMSDYAASGGYYMSCIADTIVAQPSTLTGSIGIYGMLPNAEELIGKLGVHFSTVKSHSISDFGAINRPVTASERAIMQKHINRGYETFVGRCAEGRGKTPDEIKAVAEGRVWLGCDAIELGLVDVLGGLDDAIAIAAEKANLTDNYAIAEYPVARDPFTVLMEELNGEVSARIIRARLGSKAYLYDQFSQVMNYQGVQALMPYRVSM